MQKVTCLESYRNKAEVTYKLQIMAENIVNTYFKSQEVVEAERLRNMILKLDHLLDDGEWDQKKALALMVSIELHTSCSFGV